MRSPAVVVISTGARDPARQTRSGQGRQGHGVGAWLLRDAMRRALSVSEELGVRVLLVHAIDGSARSFYERFGFEASASDPFNLQLVKKDIRETLKLPPS
jgi:hypothetical protein